MGTDRKGKKRGGREREEVGATKREHIKGKDGRTTQP
jgi:hypothetical protein